MQWIEVTNATQNNLKNISVKVPVNKITAFTGVSGSGKSSLVFGVLAAESQRQLNFTYPTFLRNRLPHGGIPCVDAISGLSTAIIIDQKALGVNRRSTVGTATDAASLLRLIFSRCGQPFVGYSPVFSFNDPVGACPHCQGLGVATEIDIQQLIDIDKSLNQGAINFKGYAPGSWYWKWYLRTGLFDADLKLRDYPPELLDKLLYAPIQPLLNPPEGWYATAKYEGVVHRFRRMYLGEGNDGHKKRYADDLSRIITTITCPTCQGQRLNQRALSCLIDGKNIAQLGCLPLTELQQCMNQWHFPEVAPALENLQSLLTTLIDLGLGYLHLNRTTPSLSGGESQRIKMVRHLNSSLTRFTYILDEPSTGLHPKDVRHLAKILIRLRDKGNTVLLVEHDSDLISIADYIVEMGPGSGSAGGQILYAGHYHSFLKHSTPTSQYLSAPRSFASPRKPGAHAYQIQTATLNNLQNIQLSIPTGLLIAMTGVAGSGKSSLMKVIQRHYPESSFIDQQPLRGSINSTLATWMGFMDRIRDRFAKHNHVSRHWFSPLSKGKCPICKGKGRIITELAFLDSTEAICEACQGSGFNQTALSWHLKGKNIAEVLALSVEDAADFFKQDNAIVAPINQLDQVGLGHLSLGRNTLSLSGGERQRVKLAAQLDRPPSLLIMDEPTSGLHGQDVHHLLSLLNKMVDTGTTIIMVEHHLDAMLAADWIIDLGPGPGKHGGRLIYNGLAADIIHVNESVTARELIRYLVTQ